MVELRLARLSVRDSSISASHAVAASGDTPATGLGLGDSAAAAPGDTEAELGPAPAAGWLVALARKRFLKCLGALGGGWASWSWSMPGSAWAWRLETAAVSSLAPDTPLDSEGV